MLGTGLVGGPAAANLAHAGQAATVRNRSVDKARALGEGGRIVETPAQTAPGPIRAMARQTA